MGEPIQVSARASYRLEAGWSSWEGRAENGGGERGNASGVVRALREADVRRGCARILLGEMPVEGAGKAGRAGRL